MPTLDRVRTAQRRVATLVLGLGLGLGVAGVGHAADEGLVLRMSAERLAAEDRCEEAIATAQRARALAPEDALAAAVEGRCALKLGRYDEAVAALEAAQRLDADLPGLSVDLLMAQYHAGNRAAAQAALERAERVAPDDARVALYRGLLLLDRAEDRQAAAAFQRARQLDASLDPLASFYAGLSLERADELGEARASLERVGERAPGSDWAREAGAALERLDRRAALSAPRLFGQATIGAEYDSNVVLRGQDVTLPNDISDEDDGRGYGAVSLGAELLRTPDWAAGVIGGVYASGHFDLSEFDVLYPNAALWLDRRVDELSFLRLEPFVGYAATDPWHGYDDYLLHGGATLSYHRDFEAAGQGVLYAHYEYDDYLYSLDDPPAESPPKATDFTRYRNRDGSDLRVGYDHALGVTSTTVLRGGVAYGHTWTKGRDYEHDHYGAHVGVGQQLPWRITADAFFRYAYEPYQRPSTFPTSDLPPAPSTHVPGAKRRDNVYQAGVQLARPLLSWLTATIYYQYTNNESNTEVFDYDRHIAGGALTASFGR